jgi:hypothetical protein
LRRLRYWFKLAVDLYAELCDDSHDPFTGIITKEAGASFGPGIRELLTQFLGYFLQLFPVLPEGCSLWPLTLSFGGFLRVFLYPILK